MPQLDVFMSENDLEQVVNTLLTSGSILIPDMPSDQPNSQELHTLAAFNEWRSVNGTTLYFAISEAWTAMPFVWGEFEVNGHKQFFIRQKMGGPTLDVFAPLPFREKNNRGILPHGFIGYHPTFWNSITGKGQKPGRALYQMYKLLANQLRCEADQRNGQNRNYIVAKGAKELLSSGYRLGPPFDLHPE